MRVWVVSDLHVDVSPWEALVPEHDLLIIAGDVAQGPAAAVVELHRIHALTGKPIVFVPGNHDFLDSTLQPKEFQGLAWPIAVLRRGSTVTIGGVRFIGATLWTDFELYEQGYLPQSWAIASMPEYGHVRHETENRLINPRDIGFEHDRDRKAVEKALSRPYAGATVVVTHHAPSPRSVPLADEKHVRWPAYASDLEELIQRHRPVLWIHGHIHEPADYCIEGTRVLSNPRGYGTWDKTRPWRQELVLDL